MANTSLEDSALKQMCDAEQGGYTGVIYLYHKTTHNVIVQWAGSALSEETKSSVQQNLELTFKDPDAASVYKSAFACESYFPTDLEIKLEPLSDNEPSSRCIVEGDLEISQASADVAAGVEEGVERVNQVISPIESVPHSSVHNLPHTASEQYQPWQEQNSVSEKLMKDLLSGISQTEAPALSLCEAKLPQIEKSIEPPQTNILYQNQADRLHKFRESLPDAKDSEEERKRKKNEAARDSMRRLRERRRMEKRKTENMKWLQEESKVLVNSQPSRSYMTINKPQPQTASFHQVKKNSQLRGAERMQVYIANEMEKQRLKRITANAAAKDCMRRMSERRRMELCIKSQVEQPLITTVQPKVIGNAVQGLKGKGSARECFRNITGRWQTGKFDQHQNEVLQRWTERLNDSKPNLSEEQRMRKNEYAREGMRRLRERRRRQRLYQSQTQSPQIQSPKVQMSRATLAKDQGLKQTTIAQVKKESMKNLKESCPVNIFDKKSSSQPTLVLSSNPQVYGSMRDTVKASQVTSVQQNQRWPQIQKWADKINSSRASLVEERKRKKNEAARDSMRRLRLRRRMSATNQGQSKELNEARETMQTLTPQPAEAVTPVGEQHDMKERVDESNSRSGNIYECGVTVNASSTS